MAKDKTTTKSTKSTTKGKTAAAEKPTLTPLEKARAAKKNGTAKAASPAKKAKVKKIEFKAPEDEKPFFVKISLAIDRDGLFTDLKAIRIKGNPEKDTAQTVDFSSWDPDTLRRLGIRFAGPAFIRNVAKRLDAKSQAQILVRVSIKTDTRVIKCGVKSVKFKLDGDKAKTLDKKDPVYRALRKPAAFLAPAFTKVRPFPTKAELKELAAEE